MRHNLHGPLDPVPNHLASKPRHSRDARDGRQPCSWSAVSPGSPGRRGLPHVPAPSSAGTGISAGEQSSRYPRFQSGSRAVIQLPESPCHTSQLFTVTSSSFYRLWGRAESRRVPLQVDALPEPTRARRRKRGRAVIAAGTATGTGTLNFVTFVHLNILP